MKKLNFAVLLSLMTASGMAAAGSIEPGTTSDTSTDIVFKEPSVITATLTAASDLTSGKVADGTTVATLKGVNSNGGAWAYRLPSNASQDWPGGYFTLTGKTNSSHKLKLKPNRDNSIGYAYKNGVASSANTFMGFANNDTAVIETDGEQNVAADTYTLSVEVAAFTA